MNVLRRGGAYLLCLTLLFTQISLSFAVSEDRLQESAEKTAQYLCAKISAPKTGSVGGEWLVLGLARGDFQVPNGYFLAYFRELKEEISGQNGAFPASKPTDYARIALAVTALGENPENVAGCDLTAPLMETENVIAQGLNGPVWALLALDAGQIAPPEGETARQAYVQEILSRQLSCGGWNLNDRGGAGEADPDMTGMVLQALANYQEQAEVQSAIQRGLAYLSQAQASDGGFFSAGVETCESTAQVVVALTALGLSVEDTRFVKNGSSALDALLAFQQEDGSFSHVLGGTGSQMATEQALYALVAARRAQEGKNTLYGMSDAEALLTGPEGNTVGLPGKNPDVREKPVTRPGRTFSDISGHEAQTAIEALAAREIVDGKGEGRFDPEGSLTRAEFATLVTAALGLTPRSTEQFRDVTEGAWYAGFVGCAYAYGIVSGTGTDTFTPNGTITRQEAAVMVTAAARLCGLDTQMGESAIRDTLSQFSDYTQSPQWARPALAFCYEVGILDDDALEIGPTQPVKRGEMALMLFRMLGAAELL